MKDLLAGGLVQPFREGRQEGPGLLLLSGTGHLAEFAGQALELRSELEVPQPPLPVGPHPFFGGMKDRHGARK